MKIALISDVHGNYPALLSVFKEIDRIKCQKIISFGDIVGYYCMINEAIALCRKNNVVNILGNHDNYLLSGNRSIRSSTVNICLDYQKKIISKDNYSWLQCSVSMYRNNNQWFVHGGWNNYLDEYVNSFNFNKLLDLSVKIFGSGHTHVQSLQINNGTTYINPGSVGQPRDGDSRAAFAILDTSEGSVSLHRICYDIDHIAFAMQDAGFDDRYYAGLYTGKKIQSFSRDMTRTVCLNDLLASAKKP